MPEDKPETELEDCVYRSTEEGFIFFLNSGTGINVHEISYLELTDSTLTFYMRNGGVVGIVDQADIKSFRRRITP